MASAVGLVLTAIKRALDFFFRFQLINNENHVPSKRREKKEGKWDAIMNKIKEGQEEEKKTKAKPEFKKPEVYKNTSGEARSWYCLLYTSPSPRDRQKSRMPSSA